MRCKIIAEVLRDDSAGTAIEYGLVVSLVSLAAILSLTELGKTLMSVFERVAQVLASAAG